MHYSHEFLMQVAADRGQALRASAAAHRSPSPCRPGRESRSRSAARPTGSTR